uniref:Si:dkey-103i16.6 n=1 Tax=Erpetoichthys calabaricus TaxID=27687 RepID=A0A8C4RZ69_ERPCA
INASVNISDSTMMCIFGKEHLIGHSLCLEDIVGFIKQKRTKNIIVMAGAGISTASGIPDFRTPGTGLYANLKKYNIPYPEAIFDIKFFTCDPRPFFLLAKELYPGKHKPNYVHYFVRMLHEKGLLLRMYTQNIDSLETIAGIPPEKLVEAHGTFSTASCHLCYTTYPAKEKEIMSGKIPRCKMCLGTVKPDVVFFGEELPERFFLHSKDFAKADLLIVMGTSLQIEPFGSIINTVRPTVPRLLLNKDHVGPFKREALKTMDVVELGDLIESVKKIALLVQIDASSPRKVGGSTASTSCVSTVFLTGENGQPKHFRENCSGLTRDKESLDRFHVQAYCILSAEGLCVSAIKKRNCLLMLHQTRVSFNI